MWSAALKGVRRYLRGPLTAELREGKEPEHRKAAAEAIVDLFADEPLELASLIGQADPDQFAKLLAPLKQHPKQARAALRDALAETVEPTWSDQPLDPRWPPLATEDVCRIEAADGIVAERFALFQTLTDDQAPALVAALRRSGYRPLQYRPYRAGNVNRLAAVWSRDGAEFHIAENLAAEPLRREDEVWRARGFMPIDVSSYATAAGTRHAALWVRKDAATADVRLFVALPLPEYLEALGRIKKHGFILRTQTWHAGPDGAWESAVWWKPVRPIEANVYSPNYNEAVYEANAAKSDFQVDVRLLRMAAPVVADRLELFRQQLAKADEGLVADWNNANLKWSRAEALIGLQRYREARPVLDEVMAAYPRSSVVLRQARWCAPVLASRTRRWRTWAPSRN